ncbi:MAG: hypothetical protein N2252_02880 [Candidatus Kryptonium sp.]|nr:hypothetical protein [Candidatus Kryptonium sp.]
MKIKRRKFLKIAVSLPAVGYLGISKIQAQEKDFSNEIEKITELVKLKYGERLSDEQMKIIKEEIEANVRRRERLLSYNLSNWDEPDFKFQV